MSVLQSKMHMPKPKLAPDCITKHMFANYCNKGSSHTGGQAWNKSQSTLSTPLISYTSDCDTTNMQKLYQALKYTMYLHTCNLKNFVER